MMYVYKIELTCKNGYEDEWYGFAETRREVEREMAEEYRRFIGCGVRCIYTVHRVDDVSSITIFSPESVFADIERLSA